MHVTKTVQFDWSAVFENFWYQKLALNRAAFYFVPVSGTSFLSVCHTYKTCARKLLGIFSTICSSWVYSSYAGLLVHL